MILSPVLAQAQPAFSGGVAGLVASASWVARGVLVVLLLFSLLSWAIILYKGMALHRSHAQSVTFLDVFRKSSKFSEVNAVCPQLRASPLVGVFQAGYLEVNQQVRATPGAGTGAVQKPTVRSLDSLSRSLARAATVEATRLERRLSFLATTASVTPFIGLFGTVWGIMTSFQDIGRSGSANITVVAPGISEALITTAMGLVAAIPAAVFFNFFSSRTRVLSAMMDDFALEFLNIVERNFT
ncbi:MAG TPA: MotA/TolQ/ExbB proton channel family protein [Vicinamibacteria bacterium]|nr:MotA/TolQ/ExbB proton channel family protein [Vicinamibacteria bacterium]